MLPASSSKQQGHEEEPGRRAAVLTLDDARIAANIPSCRSCCSRSLTATIAWLIGRTMALIEIICPNCRHSGHVGAATLPRVLRCFACGETHLADKGRQVVRSRLAYYVDDDVYPARRRPAERAE
jgi:hypothetical protein